MPARSCSPVPNGALTATNAINLNGGTLLLQNAAGEGTVNRIDSVAITSNGGGITYRNAVSAGNSYAQNFIALSLAAGQTILTSTNGQGPGDTSVLTLGGLSSSGNSTIAFMGQNLGVNGTQNSIQITGLSATPNGQIIGPWATTALQPLRLRSLRRQRHHRGEHRRQSGDDLDRRLGDRPLYDGRTPRRLSPPTAPSTPCGERRRRVGAGTGRLRAQHAGHPQRRTPFDHRHGQRLRHRWIVTSGATLYLTSGGGDLSISALIEDNAGGPLNVGRLWCRPRGPFGRQYLHRPDSRQRRHAERDEQQPAWASYDAGTVFSPLDLEGGTLQALATFSLDDGGTPPTYRNVLLGLSGGGLAAASGSTLTVDGLVSGSGGLTASGPGTIVLANTSNTYAGGTTIAGGVLNVGADGSLGATPSDIVFTANSVLQAGAA